MGIQLTEISKSYTTQGLFENVSLLVGDGERIGLVGRNGHGKTTLFRIILGQEMPDSGSVQIPEHYRIAHVAQQLKFEHKSVLAEAESALDEQEGGWREEYKAKEILHGLGFSDSDLEKPPLLLSGGMQVRLNLAKSLLQSPNLLLLDEPTNYLDVISIRWLERFLSSWSGELMLITHDRAFQDAVVTHVAGIHRCNLKKIKGNTGAYYDKIVEEEEIHEQTRLNIERKRKETERFVERFKAKASKAKAAQSRVKALGRMQQLEKLDDIENLHLAFKHDSKHAKLLITAEDIAFGYPGSEQALIKDLSFTLKPGQRIGIVGKNGKGKSTLLRILADELSPTQGNISLSQNVSSGYFAQTHVANLNPSKTIVEEVFRVNEQLSPTQVRNICGQLMFEGDAALKTVSVLSGGEKARVLLAQILARPVNLLLLDEPTNHLDLESTESLIRAIDSFPGGVVFVSHHEDMLRAIATSLIVYDKEKTFVFDGTYDNFLETIGWSDEDLLSSKQKKTEAPKLSKKEARKVRADILTRRAEATKTMRAKVESFESQITAAESRMSQINQELIGATIDGFGAKAQSLSKEHGRLSSELGALYDNLESSLKVLEEKESGFEQELSRLE